MAQGQEAAKKVGRYQGRVENVARNEGIASMLRSGASSSKVQGAFECSRDGETCVKFMKRITIAAGVLSFQRLASAERRYPVRLALLLKRLAYLDALLLGRTRLASRNAAVTEILVSVQGFDEAAGGP